MLEVDVSLDVYWLCCFQLQDGAILVFVPGWTEISNVHKLLKADSNFNTRMYPLLKCPNVFISK